MRSPSCLVLLFALLALLSCARAEEAALICDTCLSLMDNALNDLLSIIEKVGVSGSCEKVCELLPNQYEMEACFVICEYFGITEFQKILGELNPSPVSICMALTACPFNPALGGHFSSVVVSPTKGPQGATFNIEATYILNATSGTANTVLEISPPAGSPLGESKIIIGQAAGPAKIAASVQTMPQQGQTFPPGVYQVIVAVCEGQCGGTHHNEYTVAQGKSSFTITE
eukprot:TRINITY_DN5211_c0_g1_i1.p1 TRINITY_DN5211_c0_g1~~TRINITY_DN5211_c0_g1_i1.p1  ORF type:complete len:244 (-),score=48.45 TRINITY_DN5211_c0_g1_i1:138-821(-)